MFRKMPKNTLGATHPYMTGEPLPAQTWPKTRSGEVPKVILTGFDLI